MAGRVRVPMLLVLASSALLGLAGSGCEGRREPVPVSLAAAFERASFLGVEPALDLRRAQTGVDSMPTVGQSPGFVLGSGWAPRQAWGTWGLGLESTLAVHVLDPALDTLTMTMRPYHERPGRPQAVALRVNGRPCGAVELSNGWRSYHLELPPGVLVAGANRLRLTYGYSDSPRQLGRRDDDRQMAVGVRRIALSHGAAPTSRVPAVRVLQGEEVVEITRPGRLLVPLALPPGAERLALAANVHGPGSGSGSARLAARLVGLDGREDTLFEVSRTGPGALEPEARPVALPARALGPAFLELDVRFPVGARVVLERPAFLVDAGADAAGPRSGGGSHAPWSPESRPDLVVILLDAARPDHLGCYGYPRPTTPEIDRLAEDALVFRHARAESPYTVASVATLLSGLPPTAHGVVRTDQRLPDEVPSLVEELHAAGYATVGVSASIYDSRACGSARGFERFEELWTEHPYPDFADPALLSRRAVAELERGTDGRPLFLLLHYEAPHEPYAPASPFDAFSDPGYEGPVDGSPSTLARIRHGELPLGPADRAQLTALYDGNLRAADAAVGRVLAALRARPRWDDTVVVVLADHGEAFFEHGEQGHNSTVYDEMLRVPLIVRLPPGRRGGSVDADRLAVVGDVAPTLLGLAGIAPGRPFASLDLLAPAPAGARVVVARSGGNPPQWAVITPCWKAVAAGTNRRELYDLVRDPGEKIDLAARRPLLLDGLLHLLARTAAPGAPTAPPSGLSDDERAKLRSLGYL